MQRINFRVFNVKLLVLEIDGFTVVDLMKALYINKYC